MYFLLDACQHPGVLRALYFGLLIRDIVFTIIPIGIVLMTIVDFSKAVVAGKEDEQQKAVKLIPKRIMYAIIVFAIPWIVWIIMKTLSGLKLNVALNYTTCINNAESGAENGFKKYDEMLEVEENIEKDYQSYLDNMENSKNIGGIYDNSAAEKLLSIIRNEINSPYKGEYGGNNGDPWCAYFTTWSLKKVQLNGGISIYQYLSRNAIISDGEASGMWPAFRNSTNSNVNFYKSKAYGGVYKPKGGDIIWFQWDPAKSRYSYCRKNYGYWDGNSQCADHIGIVEYVENNKVHTIEGNVGKKVSRREYQLNDDQIVAYGSWY